MYRYIKAMSDKKEVIYRRISDPSDRIIEHIIKLVLFSDSTYCNHWKQEIFGFLNRIPSLKSSGKYPKASWIYTALTIYNDQLSSMISDIKEDCSSLNARSITDASIENAVEDYQLWLANNLSENGRVRLQDVYNKLDEIIKNY